MTNLLKLIEKMDKSDFKNLIIDPLMETFGVPIYFNSEKLILEGYDYIEHNLQKGMLACYENEKGEEETIIVVKWERNKYQTLFTLLHEIGHFTFRHFDNYNCQNDELEADAFAGLCFCALSKNQTQLENIIFNNNIPMNTTIFSSVEDDKKIQIKNGIDKLRKAFKGW